MNQFFKNHVITSEMEYEKWLFFNILFSNKKLDRITYKHDIFICTIDKTAIFLFRGLPVCWQNCS